MGKGLVKIKDKYFIWSSIADSPITYAMDKNEAIEAMKEEGFSNPEKCLEETEKRGTSYRDMTLDRMFKFNRAGENGESLSEDEIYDEYLGE